MHRKNMRPLAAMNISEATLEKCHDDGHPNNPQNTLFSQFLSRRMSRSRPESQLSLWLGRGPQYLCGGQRFTLDRGLQGTNTWVFGKK